MRFLGLGGSPGTPGSPNVKTAWTQLTATTPFEVREVWMDPSWFSSSARSRLWDIGIGAAGDEQVIIPDYLSAGPDAPSKSPSAFPLLIPAGTRIAVRQQTGPTAEGDRCELYLCDETSHRRFVARIETAGVDVANSRGTSIDPGATPDTKGTWHQLIASTTTEWDAAVIAFGNGCNAARISETWFFDIAIGASGDEQVVIGDVRVIAYINTLQDVGRFGMFRLRVPKSTRLSMRSSCTTADATDRLLDAALYGLAVEGENANA